MVEELVKEKQKDKKEWKIIIFTYKIITILKSFFLLIENFLTIYLQK